MKINFTVYGKPIPQARAIVTTRGSKPHGYYPKRCEDWREIIGWTAKSNAISATGKVSVLLKGALALKAVFYLPKPKSKPRSEKYPTTQREGDLKNYVSALEDALEGICFINDAQIVQHNTLKVYCSQNDGEKPRIEIEITELEH